MNRIIKTLVVLGITLAPYAASAASDADSTPIPMASPPQQYFTIEMSKGKLVHLSSAASSVIAADPTIADVQVISPTLIYINAKNVGETTVFAVDSKDNEILRSMVTVTHNLSKLNSIVKDIIPDSKVQFKSVDNALVIDGDVDSPLQEEEVRKLATPFVKNGQTLVNMMHPLGSNQVMLKVRVAEVDRTEMKNFGISLQNLSNAGNFAFGILNGRLNTTGVVTPGTLTGSGTTGGTLFGSFTDGSNTINGVIDALEADGLVSTLDEPTLTTQSGQPASFLEGGQIPIPVISGSGASATVGIQYEPYGVSLSFVPVVLSKDRINLTVAPTVSALSQTGAINNGTFSIPALTTRQASTTVELGSGQSFAIAGLIENDRNNNINKFPFLGDIPVLGTLFRSNQFQHNQTELVIIVTPYIVDGVDDAKKLHDPTQGLVMASDAERILLGKLWHEEPAGIYSTDSESPHLMGVAGYQLK